MKLFFVGEEKSNPESRFYLQHAGLRLCDYSGAVEELWYNRSLRRYLLERGFTLHLDNGFGLALHRRIYDPQRQGVYLLVSRAGLRSHWMSRMRSAGKVVLKAIEELSIAKQKRAEAFRAWELGSMIHSRIVKEEGD